LLGAPAPEAPRVAEGAANLAPPVALDNVTYLYPGTETAVLQNATMTIPARASVGLVGATGSGKSTIIDLVVGLLTPKTGTISLNGQGLTRERAAAWRGRVGYVPQALFLLDDSIRRNIAFGLHD